MRQSDSWTLRGRSLPLCNRCGTIGFTRRYVDSETSPETVLLSHLDRTPFPQNTFNLTPENGDLTSLKFHASLADHLVWEKVVTVEVVFGFRRDETSFESGSTSPVTGYFRKVTHFPILFSD